jgi:hypothetical protein
MKPKVLMRFASGLLFIYASGHTIVHFTRHRSRDIVAQKVMKTMSEYKINMYGQMRSYDESYSGMSMNMIFSLVSFSLILWILSNFAERNRVLVRASLVPVSICLVGYTITGFLFFFPAPAYASFISAVLTIVAFFMMVKKQAETAPEFLNKKQDNS